MVELTAAASTDSDDSSDIFQSPKCCGQYKKCKSSDGFLIKEPPCGDEVLENENKSEKQKKRENIETRERTLRRDGDVYFNDFYMCEKENCENYLDSGEAWLEINDDPLPQEKNVQINKRKVCEDRDEQEDSMEQGMERRVSKGNAGFIPEESFYAEGKTDEYQSSSQYCGDEIRNWLDSIGMIRYSSTFIQEEIDVQTMPFISELDLVCLGVNLIGHRKKILMHAGSHLRSNGNKKCHNAVPSFQMIPDCFGLVVDGFHSDAKSLGSAFVLTHFHSDHYKGLTKSFRGPLYCTYITAKLCHKKLSIPWSTLRVLPLGEKHSVAECNNIRITFIDANHIRGACMVLIEPPTALDESNSYFFKPILHTGDFRFDEGVMTRNVNLQDIKQKQCTLILDTTYCSPQYKFPTQEDVINYVVSAIKAENFNPKTLFLIGTYNVGKEHLFLSVAKQLKQKVYCGKAKHEFLDCLALTNEELQCLTSKDSCSNIHIVTMGQLSWKRMKNILRYYKGKYSTVVSFKPTGWSLGRQNKGCERRGGRTARGKGTLVLYEVPYSEHSSFEELRDFVQWLQPGKIIPSVGCGTEQSSHEMITRLYDKANSNT